MQSFLPFTIVEYSHDHGMDVVDVPLNSFCDEKKAIISLFSIFIYFVSLVFFSVMPFLHYIYRYHKIYKFYYHYRYNRSKNLRTYAQFVTIHKFISRFSILDFYGFKCSSVYLTFDGLGQVSFDNNFSFVEQINRIVCL